MARKKNEESGIKQESVRTPAAFDYPVSVIPYKDSKGKNKLDFQMPNGKSAKELPVQSSHGSGKDGAGAFGTTGRENRALGWSCRRVRSEYRHRRSRPSAH